MTTATAIEPLTAADVLHADRCYAPSQVEELLGIPQQVMSRAIERGRRRGVMSPVDGLWSSWTGCSDWHMPAPSILDWIEREGIPHEVTDTARLRHRREQQDAEHQARVAELKALEQAWSASPEAQLLKLWNERPINPADWREYSELLRRSEFTLDDVAVLSRLRRRLGLTTMEQVQTHRTLLLLAAPQG